MKKHLLRWLLISAVLVVPLLGLSSCESTGGAAPPAAPLYASKADFDAQMLDVRTRIDAKASKDDISKLTLRVDNLASQGGASTNAYTKAETYTRAEVKAEVDAAIAALKANQAWITGGTGGTGGGTTVPATGIITYVFQGGVQPDVVGPPISKAFVVRVTNGNATLRYIRLMVTLTPSPTIPVVTFTPPYTLTATADGATITFVATPFNVGTPAICTGIQFTSDIEMIISGATYKDIILTLTLVGSPATQWNTSVTGIARAF